MKTNAFNLEISIYRVLSKLIDYNLVLKKRPLLDLTHFE